MTSRLPENIHILMAGAKIIDRPIAEPDPPADVFETRLLKWLQYHLKVKPASYVGTNTLFWKFDYQGSKVSMAVIGQSKNTGVPLSNELDWLLRVEESEPLRVHAGAGKTF